ncbi:hypothetical protein CWB41_05225 [Methylovirgula ligni]|uniref:hypothetical protein n=1 Tax=Methylovirgula ligni TaxID=569860 RepID=UPI000E26FA08|nr:hypothetical protein [Methylovirgula ligni]QAY95205.1 hypothetical protein CWB41_05225 [Methylovirgula ligni]
MRPKVWDWNKGWEPGRQRETRPSLRLERHRSELPRGKDMAAHIGAELRTVLVPHPTEKLSGLDELLARIDAQIDARRERLP